MAKSRLSGKKGRIRVLSTKVIPQRGICILVENGVPCAEPIDARGICKKHLTYLRAHKRLDEFALPVNTEARKHVFRLKHRQEPGICRVSVNGIPCRAPGKRRGLCVKHYQAIWQRPDLKLEDFCTPQVKGLGIRLRKVLVDGVCRVRQDGADCNEPIHARGLCKKHYRLLHEQHPALFEEIAAPDPKARTLALRVRPEEGRCRVAENGQGCPEAQWVRGICQHHYQVLRKTPELLEAIAVPAREVSKRRFEKREVTPAGGLVCVVVENGVPCSRPPEHRGVCRHHRKLISQHKEYAIADFYLPEPETSLEPKLPEELADGLCRIIEDGQHCRSLPKVRGLCRRHHRMAVDRGVLDTLAEPPREKRNRYGSGNDRPHLYLDKNVLFDHADNAVFGSVGQSASVAIVERVMKGDVRGAVSSDAIKSTYNHLRHRLARPVEEGGRAMPEDEAEAIAHAHVQRVFYSRGAWRILCSGCGAFRQDSGVKRPRAFPRGRPGVPGVPGRPLGHRRANHVCNSR